jgi:zinc D-Ala-D-Ala dipeptidase
MSLLPYHSVPIVESREPLVPVSCYPFMALPVYYYNGWSATPTMFARKQVLDKLAEVQAEHLQPRGLRWVVYDAWRPRTVQAAIYQHYWRQMSREMSEMSRELVRARVSTFVSIPDDPLKTPPHSTGGAIDLGWWDCHAGTLVDMGSAFDEFCDRAASHHYEHPSQDVNVRNRRRQLREWLSEAGFQGDGDEWFHHDWGTQKWALQAGLPEAHYGEVLACRELSGRVDTQFACDEHPSDRTERVHRLQASLDLQHPAAKAPALLPTINSLMANLTAMRNNSRLTW